MKIKFDVTTQELAIIRQVLESTLPAHCKVWVFGSRAKNQAKYNSDLDLAIECSDALDKTTLMQLETQFDESRLPYRVDIVDLNKAEPYFKEIVERQKVEFPFKRKVPGLRFPEFQSDWMEKPLSFFVQRYSKPVDVSADEFYQEIGVRSHARGVFHKTPVQGKSLGNKRVFWVHPKAFVVNIVFGWEQAVALTSENEAGFIASHRFPMFLPKEKRVELEFLLSFFKRKRGKYLLGLASPGGAGRNKTLGQNEFLNLYVSFPEIEEQIKISAFLSTVDKKLNMLRRKHELLGTYKRGLMQKIFSQEIRFKQDDGSDFPDWEEKKIGEVYSWVSTNSLSREKLTRASGKVQNIHYGDIHTKFPCLFEQQNAGAPYIIDDEFVRKTSVDRFCRVGDVVIADASEDYKDIGKAIEIVSVKENSLLAGLHTYIARPNIKLALGYSGFVFQSDSLRKQVMKIAQGVSVLGISKSNLEKLGVQLPAFEEQQKIANCLTIFDQKIDAVAQQITQLETFKQGLLQKMFV